MPKFYITTAIDYPNGKPHIGHAYEKIIQDMIARWRRLKGDDVFSLTGSDENSQNIVEKAQKEERDVKEFIDTNVAIFKKLYALLNVSYNRFIRTTEEAHKKISKELFQRVYDKGDIYKGMYVGLYCQSCERFYTEKDVVDTLCPVHKRPVKHLEEESYFFKLSNYQDALITHIGENPHFVQPEHKRMEILNRLKEPLRDLSVSRTSITWGIQTPIDKTHVIYVWFDALINYLSGVDYPGKNYKKYWPPDVQIIGKDIAWFHVVIWPIMLMAANIPLPRIVHSHGFVNLKGQKLSKSTGIVVDPLALVDKYGADPLRYYLLREIPAGQDGDFSEEALVERANADLGDALGNLANRTLTLVEKYCNGKIPRHVEFTTAEHELVHLLTQTVRIADHAMLAFDWHRALETIFEFIHATNRYINAQAPWKQTDVARRDTVLYTVIEALRCTAILLYAFIPRTSESITKMIGQKPQNLDNCVISTTTSGKIKKPDKVFIKFELPKQETSPGDAPDPFSKLDLRVGVIKTVTNHPDADKLYILSVDLGSEVRTIVSGLRAYLSAGDLVGKHIVVLTNLKPATLRGVMSHGMLLAADKNGTLALLEALKSDAGTRVYIDGITSSPVNQITHNEFKKISLIVRAKHAQYNDKQLRTNTELVHINIAEGAIIR